ncbi:hypothetical protein SAMN04488012_12210 [Palleronia salina]|uniref:Uncharacterized protein n=1 Tax=Palleronia salina TaxID=313368 RepID=A0A1M6MA18_9RHOB|nr:hypothetical protein SAMN04488012_12210 [Palleronia salina]
MNPISVNGELNEVNKSICANSKEGKTHGLLLLRDLIAASKTETVDTLRLGSDDDDELFDNVPI